jgi:hypothetical protein
MMMMIHIANMPVAQQCCATLRVSVEQQKGTCVGQQQQQVLHNGIELAGQLRSRVSVA